MLQNLPIMLCCNSFKMSLLCSLVPRPIPLESHRSGVFGDVRITSGGRDLSECADLSDCAGRAPAVVKR